MKFDDLTPEQLYDLLKDLDAQTAARLNRLYSEFAKEIANISGVKSYLAGKKIKSFSEMKRLYSGMDGKIDRLIEQIYDIVWQEPYSGDYNIVMSHIRHIREKIEDNPGKPLYIQTVWGIGYRFNKNLSSSL